MDSTIFSIVEKPKQTFTPSVLGSEIWMELEDHQEASGTLESPMMGPIRQRHMLNNCGSQETNGSLLHGLLRWRGKDMFSVFFLLGQHVSYCLCYSDCPAGDMALVHGVK